MSTVVEMAAWPIYHRAVITGSRIPRAYLDRLVATVLVPPPPHPGALGHS
jgi:hypothetical protein